MMVPMAVSLIAPIASSLIKPVTCSLINNISGKGVMRVGKGQEGGFLPLLALPLIMKVLQIGIEVRIIQIRFIPMIMKRRAR